MGKGVGTNQELMQQIPPFCLCNGGGYKISTSVAVLLLVALPNFIVMPLSPLII